MKKCSITLPLTLLAGLGLLASCSTSHMDEVAPTPSVSANAVIAFSQQPISALEIVSTTGNIVYFRVPATEASGGNQLYTWQSTAANNDQLQPAGYPNAARYVSSPGAISIAAASDDSEPLIVDVNHNIQYRKGGTTWSTLDAGALRFNAIATRDFVFRNTSPVQTSGLLYAIGTDGYVYQLAGDPASWSQVGSQQATAITIDATGHPWLLAPIVRNTTSNIYRAAGYSQTFNGWVAYQGLGTMITCTDGGTPGIAILSPGRRDGSGVYAYWESLGTPANQNNFTVLTDGSIKLKNISGVGSQTKLWLMSSSNDVFRADFAGQ